MSCTGGRQRRFCGGFSLIELMVTLVVMAILFGMGWPSFQNLIRTNQVSTAANEFLHGIWLTRASAIRLNAIVTMCASKDGSTCGGQWHEGWLVFVDRNANARLDTGDEVLLVAGALPGRIRVCGNRLVRRMISYRASGIGRTATGGLQLGTITVFFDEQAQRQIVLNSAGRPRVARGRLTRQRLCAEK